MKIDRFRATTDGKRLPFYVRTLEKYDGRISMTNCVVDRDDYHLTPIDICMCCAHFRNHYGVVQTFEI